MGDREELPDWSDLDDPVAIEAEPMVDTEALMETRMAATVEGFDLTKPITATELEKFGTYGKSVTEEHLHAKTPLALKFQMIADRVALEFPTLGKVEITDYFENPGYLQLDVETYHPRTGDRLSWRNILMPLYSARHTDGNIIREMLSTAQVAFGRMIERR
jgi:hypothetical protein